MRTLLVLLVSSLALACGGTDSETETPAGEAAAVPTVEPTPRRALRDEEAERVYALMRQAIDSDTGWQETRYLEFDWVLWRGAPVLTRSYRFAPWRGDFRVETEVDGRTMVAIGNWNRPGPARVWLDGEEIQGDSAIALRRRAERMFEVDANTLLLPFRWDDIRVGVTYAGRESAEDGTEVEVVELTESSRSSADTTPRLFQIDAESGLPVRTVTPAPTETGSPTVLTWTGWEEHGPLLLSTRRETGGPSELRFENITVLPSIPEGSFDPPG